MDISDYLLNELPGSVNREGKVVSALLCNNKKNGVIENEVKRWKEFTNYYLKDNNVYKQTDDLLDKSVEFFSFLKRFYNENDKSLIKRFKSILYRGGNSTWGTPYDVITVFNNYFSGHIYLMECVDDFKNNLLKNGEFKDDTDFWELTEGAELSTDARFSLHNGVSLHNGKLSQKVVIPNGSVYFLHWFMKGNINVQIKNLSDNTYWNPNTNEWGITQSQTLYKNSEWKNEYYHFSLKNIPDGDSELEITFEGISDSDNYIDYLFLFHKYNYNSFTVIVQNEGDNAEGSLALAEGNEDDPERNIPENVEVKAENWGYYNQAFVTGPMAGYSTDMYNELLDYIKSVGYKTSLEFVAKGLVF